MRAKVQHDRDGDHGEVTPVARRGVVVGSDKIDDMLISVDELTEAMLSDRPPVILDVRWQLGDSHGHQHYRDGHIPGAVYVDLDRELAAPPSPEDGRHPLPDTTPGAIAALAGRGLDCLRRARGQRGDVPLAAVLPVAGTGRILAQAAARPDMVRAGGLGPGPGRQSLALSWAALTGRW